MHLKPVCFEGKIGCDAMGIGVLEPEVGVAGAWGFGVLEGGVRDGRD
jgi:hypothetical protein